MVGCKLLAQMDLKLREVIREIGTAKLSNGRTRPFGGLNVIVSGDFWQLDPPDGGFLGAIPTEFIAKARKYQPAPSIAHGQALLWGGGEHGIQGVTELVQCERCDDAWLREVQSEVRNGDLSLNNHAFLHGAVTTVPGSWVAGDVACGRAQCRALAHFGGKRPAPHKGDQATYIQEKECSECKKERKSKALVAHAANDSRFAQDDFLAATAIFPNNDLKYETNKVRAKAYAEAKHAALTYCPAKDRPSNEALRERPDLPSQKLSWLQRHDRESGDLYGVVSLVPGMPVALTDHIDRNPDKQLLRGKVGEIHSWILDEKETSVSTDGVRVLAKLPKVVMVKFRTPNGGEVAWRLPGTTENGLYPVVPRSGTWFLDKARQHPILKITRKQLPLAPAFAMTTHAAQGQTLRGGAIVDLCIGKGSNPLGSYVAMTRVTCRQKLLIYRPFPIDMFRRGGQRGPELLLRQLRGEKLDWKAIEEEHMPSRLCKGCNFVRYKEAFLPGQWNREDKLSYCRACVEGKVLAGTPLRCNNCGVWKNEASFEEKHRNNGCLKTRVCNMCIERRKCRGVCGEYYDEDHFTKGEWEHASRPHSTRGKCKKCMERSIRNKSCHCKASL